MKYLLCICLALGLIVIGSSLKCKSCNFHFLGTCFDKGDEACNNGSCFHTKVKLGSATLFSRQGCETGCTARNGTDTVFKFPYDTTCCNTDMCNSGNSIKISLSVGLGIGLLWLLNAV